MSNFEGTWTLCRSTSFDDTFDAEWLWNGSFMECMTIVAYENLGPLHFDLRNKTIVVLYDLLSEEEEEAETDV